MLALVFGLLVGCASGDSEGSGEADFTAGDLTEDTVFPYAGGWLDPPKALAGIGQFDRLKGTKHDDVKCSTMVAIAAGVVGGEARFLKLVDVVAKKREGRKDDLAILEKVRAAVAERRLTPRLIHEYTDVIVRAYNLLQGAFDEQIGEMIRASGYEAVNVGSKKPQVLIDRLGEAEVVPLATVAEGIPHITLIWKDKSGTVRLYDSDDVKGPHVMPRGSTPYNERVTHPESGWELKEKYR